jgi:hypothetical protein
MHLHKNVSEQGKSHGLGIYHRRPVRVFDNCFAIHKSPDEGRFIGRYAEGKLAVMNVMFKRGNPLMQHQMIKRCLAEQAVCPTLKGW